MGRSSWGLDSEQVMDWRVRAACRDSGYPDAWIVVTAVPTPANRHALAKCHRCPVQAACLSWYESLPPVMRQDVIAGGKRWDAKGEPHRVARRPPHPDAELSTAEAATYLFVTPQTVKNMCRDGRIKAVQNERGHWRIRAEDLPEVAHA